jgi:hypothetical protein
MEINGIMKHEYYWRSGLVSANCVEGARRSEEDWSIFNQKLSEGIAFDRCGDKTS